MMPGSARPRNDACVCRNRSVERMTGKPEGTVATSLHSQPNSSAPFRAISSRPIKNPPAGIGRVLEWFAGLCADDVCRLEAFGALQQVKLHGLTLVERAVTVLLDGGEVHEHIFPRGALDESIPFRPVEPLHCTFLSHGKNSFHQSLRIILQLSRSSPRSFEVPLREAGRTLCACNVWKEVLPKMKKTPQFFTTALIRSVNFGARQFGAFPPHPTTITLFLLVSPPDHSPALRNR